MLRCMEKITTPHSYSNAEMVALYRECLAVISVRGARYRMPNGVEYTSLNIPDVLKLLDHFEAAAAADAAGVTGLVTNYAYNVGRFG